MSRARRAGPVALPFALALILIAASIALAAVSALPALPAAGPPTTKPNVIIILTDDQGFGDAAMKMTKLFKMRPQTKDGAPVDGGKITIPIVFNVPKG